MRTPTKVAQISRHFQSRRASLAVLLWLNGIPGDERLPWHESAIVTIFHHAAIARAVTAISLFSEVTEVTETSITQLSVLQSTDVV